MISGEEVLFFFPVEQPGSVISRRSFDERWGPIGGMNEAAWGGEAALSLFCPLPPTTGSTWKTVTAVFFDSPDGLSKASGEISVVLKVLGLCCDGSVRFGLIGINIDLFNV